MQYLVDCRAEDSLIDPAAADAARAKIFPFFQALQSDPRVIYSGYFTDGRHVLLLLELNSHEELLEFTGPFLDFVRYEVQPILPMARALSLVEAMLAMTG